MGTEPNADVWPRGDRAVEMIPLRRSADGINIATVSRGESWGTQTYLTNREGLSRA